MCVTSCEVAENRIEHGKLIKELRKSLKPSKRLNLSPHLYSFQHQNVEMNWQRHHLLHQRLSPSKT